MSVQDAIVDVVARAMFISSCSNRDPAKTWSEILLMPSCQTTVEHYRRLARVAIGAYEGVYA